MRVFLCELSPSDLHFSQGVCSAEVDYLICNTINENELCVTFQLPMHSDIDDVLFISLPKQEPMGAAGSDALGPAVGWTSLLLLAGK